MSDRLSPLESFRAKAWRNLRRREDVHALSHRGRTLLEGIVHDILNPLNNGALTLGPATLRRFNLHGRGMQQETIAELLKAKLLRETTERQRRRCTRYLLPSLPWGTGHVQPVLTAHGQAALSPSSPLP